MKGKAVSADTDKLHAIWEHDVLGRRNDATYLQNYLSSRYKSDPEENGFVLAVDAEWGYGKSFMIERWKQEVELQGYPAIYFDAWQNDFTPDPLLAFISELDDGLTKNFTKLPVTLKKEKAKALRALKKVLKPAATIIATTALKHITGHSLQSIKELLAIDSSNDDDSSFTDEASTAAKEAAKKVGDAVKNALEPHKTIKESIRLFKDDLALLIDHLKTVPNVNLPILVFVDELDRCRPDYAIELLEGIKHLFGVPGVTFVVATNLAQLSESTKAIYGSGFDGQRYLQRFFDLHYTISRPDNHSFSRLALEKIARSIPSNVDSLAYGLQNDSAVHPLRTTSYEIIDYIAFVVSIYADNFDLSLRDISQVVTMLEACFITLKNDRIQIFFLVFLISLYKSDPASFKKLNIKRRIDDQIDERLLSKNGKITKFKINNIDEFGRSFGINETSASDVARNYISHLEVSNFNNISFEGFPFKNLNASEYKRETGNGNFIAPFNKYFSIVEQAGGFIQKKKMS